MTAVKMYFLWRRKLCQSGVGLLGYWVFNLCCNEFLQTTTLSLSHVISLLFPYEALHLNSICFPSCRINDGATGRRSTFNAVAGSACDRFAMFVSGFGLNG